MQEIASALSARGHASRGKHHISSRLQCTSLNPFRRRHYSLLHFIQCAVNCTSTEKNQYA